MKLNYPLLEIYFVVLVYKCLTLIQSVYVLIACEHMQDLSFCFTQDFQPLSEETREIIMTWSEESKLHAHIML